MSPGAVLSPFRRGTRDRRGTALATVVAVLFAVVAAISFAVDISVTLSSLPAPAASVAR
jgi:hypothetical protein